MKTAGILTLYGNRNYGNKLQSYAVQEVLKKIGLKPITIANNEFHNCEKKNVRTKIHLIGSLLKNNLVVKTGAYRIKNSLYCDERTKQFIDFNKNINYTKHFFNGLNYKKFDYYFVGSDQVWNPNFGLGNLGFLPFVSDNKKIAISASFGVDSLPEQFKEKVESNLKKFKAISVREDSAKNIIENITERKDVEVILDPTMLLDKEDWDKILKKPKQIETINNKKYILNYFLGKMSEERRKIITDIAKKNDCVVINILDKNDPFYISGPSEFIWLEKNAFLICTDSFHSSVFAILYEKPFIVFNRDDGQVGKNSMNSRLETLLKKFKLEDRYFDKKISDDLLKCNYNHVNEILKIERDNAIKFLKESLK